MPLKQRLTVMGGRTNRSVVAMIADPSANFDSRPRASFVCDAHAEARRLETSLISVDYNTANIMHPRGNAITSAADHSSDAKDPLLTIFTEVTRPLNNAAAAPNGVRFIPAGMRNLMNGEQSSSCSQLPLSPLSPNI